MTIKPSVINSLNRVGFPYQNFVDLTEKVTVSNRFSGESCATTPLVSNLIEWVYNTSNAYGRGDRSVKTSDFDRIRYFVLALDSNAYMTCLD